MFLARFMRTPKFPFLVSNFETYLKKVVILVLKNENENIKKLIWVQVLRSTGTGLSSKIQK
jgi:hypothetical protein